MPIEVDTRLPPESFDPDNCVIPYPPENPGSCGGASTWIMRRKCRYGTNSIYEWEQASSSCRGGCESNGCRAVPPSVLPTTHISDEDAEAAGYLALLDGDPQPGTCECVEIVDPVCGDECSTWYVRRKCYDGSSSWQYYFEPVANSCATNCNSPNLCLPKPPFVIPPELMDDAAAAAFSEGNLLDMLDTIVAGSCECGTEEYEEPPCPECDCDTETANKTFTISGLAAPDDVFNGTYTLVKGDLDCAFAPVTCCWYGCEEDVASCAILTFSGGVWFLTIQNGADYEAVGTACDGSIIMDKVSDLTTGDVFPATLTVSAVP
jgi:hypothetical protein